MVRFKFSIWARYSKFLLDHFIFIGNSGSMKFNKAYKFRLHLNNKQQELINKTFGCCRFLYNQMLSERISIYEQLKEDKESLHKYKYKTEKQFKQEFDWLKEVDAVALQQSRRCLETAYKNFFTSKGKIGFPKFKSKKDSTSSYATYDIKIIENKYVKLPKIGYVRVKCHRQILDNEIIKSATISKTPTGKYFISILVEYEKDIPQLSLNKENSLGIDYSSSSFYVDSQGNEANYPRYFILLEDKLAREQRKLSKMQKGSNNRNKQVFKVAKIHEKISNCRKDFCHKLSHKLSEEFDYICLEDINLHGLAQTLHLGKSTNDNGFGMFRQFLSYKMFKKGKHLIRIDKWFPSSKTCHCCGSINKELTLNDRIWVCPSCGETIYRDINAAINIRDVGLSLI